ncbi:hypothetical protein QR680_015154 [Steinernema hermaphroditum]|uniref:SCP domain-containing protein n=1 Tax=Steinernema hermaphroditum TaxID=289476 RepID=A0AA39M5H0_9BILA|nr:hypothetical protein QR680_015154 [Steinernema hermaphroditum]
MSLQCLITLVSVALFVSIEAQENCANSGSPFAMSDRKGLVDAHNKFRSSNARGLEKDGPNGGNAPKASNMYKMSYSCELEAIAQAWANKCLYKHSGHDGLGENLYTVWPAQNNNSPLQDAPASWWSELVEDGVGQYSEDFTMTDDVFNAGTGHYTQMAWARTTEVGCGISHCRNGRKSQSIVVCNYREQGNYIDEKIYEIGEPCSNCNEFTGSTCSRAEGLCVKP